LLMHTKSVECARSTIYAANVQKGPTRSLARRLVGRCYSRLGEKRQRIEFG
jgi:hypothetical protein